MKHLAKWLGYGALLIAASLALIGSVLANPYWQGLVGNLAASFLEIGLAIVVVNHLLSSSDKKLAAKPLLKLITPNMQLLHNDLFIRYGRASFGKVLARFEN